jgi:hypothetical protein
MSVDIAEMPVAVQNPEVPVEVADVPNDVAHADALGLDGVARALQLTADRRN